MREYYRPRKEEISSEESSALLKQKRISQKESEAHGRRTVIILFLITLTLSLFFWLKKEIPAILRQIIKPYEVVIEKGGE